LITLFVCLCGFLAFGLCHTGFLSAVFLLFAKDVIFPPLKTETTIFLFLLCLPAFLPNNSRQRKRREERRKKKSRQKPHTHYFDELSPKKHDSESKTFLPYYLPTTRRNRLGRPPYPNNPRKAISDLSTDPLPPPSLTPSPSSSSSSSSAAQKARRTKGFYWDRFNRFFVVIVDSKTTLLSPLTDEFRPFQKPTILVSSKRTNPPINKTLVTLPEGAGRF
jgi:hypothetical protein